MTSVTSVFIKSNEEFSAIRIAVEKALDVQFMLEQDDVGSRYVCNTLCLTLILFDDHGLEDDMGIEFTAYPYELDVMIDRRSIDGDLCDQFHYEATLFLAAKLRGRLGLECIAVQNLQRIMTE